MQSTAPQAGQKHVAENPAGASRRSRQRGDFGASAMLVLGGLVVAAIVGYVAGHKTSGKPTAEGQAVAKAQAKIDATEVKVDQENAAQVKAGQQFAAATTSALAAAGPEAKADPAVQLASKTAAKADQALALGAGPLTPAQVDWVTKLVADAISPEVARRAQAEAALQDKTADLQKSVQREADLTTRIGVLEQDKREADAVLIAHDADASAFRARVRFWCFILVGGYVLVAFVLPVLAKAFPVVAPLAKIAHGIVGGLWSKWLAEKEALARDASGALHSVLQVAEKTNSIAAMKAEAAQWITPADGTDTRYQAALKEANVV